MAPEGRFTTPADWLFYLLELKDTKLGKPDSLAVVACFKGTTVPLKHEQGVQPELPEA